MTLKYIQEQEHIAPAYKPISKEEALELHNGELFRGETDTGIAITEGFPIKKVLVYGGIALLSFFAVRKLIRIVR